MEEVKVFCPATIANLACGFDVLGLALDGAGDVMTVKKVNQPGVRITRVEGAKNLPLEADKNVAGVAAMAIPEIHDQDFGFEIEIQKKIKPGSGIGSSAASAAGAVVAVNALLGNPYSRQELIPFAMEGERLASGVPHADNIAPGLLGGIALVRSYSPLDVVKLHTPEALHCVVIHPQIEIKTQDAREILRSQVSVKDAVTQWGNLAGLVSGLYQEDYDLIGRSLEDVIVEPNRSLLIPGFQDVKLAALQAGALGCSISGSGPSIFALCKGSAAAKVVKKSIEEAYESVEIPYEIIVSKVNQSGVTLL